jgi:hypothetical protein
MSDGPVAVCVVRNADDRPWRWAAGGNHVGCACAACVRWRWYGVVVLVFGLGVALGMLLGARSVPRSPTVGCDPVVTCCKGQ